MNFGPFFFQYILCTVTDQIFTKFVRKFNADIDFSLYARIGQNLNSICKNYIEARLERFSF